MGDQTADTQRVKARRGCFFYGCISGALLLLVMLVGAILGLRYFKRMVTEFTDTRPAVMPAVPLSPEQVSQVEQRFESFRDSVRAGKTVQPLELNSDEVNALILTNTDFQPLKGKLYITLEDSSVKGRISLPMEEAGLKAFHGRYLNGTGTFDLSARDGIVRLTAQSLQIKNRAVPEGYMEKIRLQNLAKDINNDPRTAAALNWIKNIEVKDGKLIVVPR